MYSRCKFFNNLRTPGTNLCRCKESTGAGKKNVYSKLFFSPKVQQILFSITDSDPEKVFRLRYENRPLKPTKYELLTSEDLKQEEFKLEKKMKILLQVPPLINPIEDKLEVLESQPSLDGHDFQHAKFVFTDLSDEKLNEERIIVVREPNGVLRKAFRNEKHRMNMIFFPLKGRCYETPKMFEKEFLQKLIDDKKYYFILERACVQFDPDDSAYHEVIEATYEAINDNFDFEALQSTRHFGSLAFYLVSHKKIDNMLIYMMKSEKLQDAASLITLYYLIHPSASSSKNVENISDEEMIESFIANNAVKKSELELELQYYNEKKNYKLEVQENQ